MDGSRSILPPASVNPVVLTLVLTSLIAATYGFGVYLFPAMMPDMVEAFSMSYAEAGRMISLAQIGFLLSALASGFLTQKIGPFRMVLFSVLTSALCLGLVAFVTDEVFLTPLLFVLGATSASVWVPMVAIAKRFIPASHQGKAFGLMSSGTAYGVFINGLAIPALLPEYGWQAVWIFVSSLTFFLLFLAWLVLSGLTIKPEVTASVEQEISLESRAGSLFRPRVLIVPLLMFLAGLACIPTQNYLISLVRDELHYGVVAAANLWTVIGVVGMFGGFAMGILADKITVPKALSLSFILLAVSDFTFLHHGSLIEIYFGAACLGLAFNAIFGLVPAYVSLTYPPEMAVRIFGFGNVMLGIGAMIGNFLGGFLRDQTGSFEFTYMIALMLAGVLTVLSFYLWKRSVSGSLPEAI